MKTILRILYLAATVYWRIFKPLTMGVKLLLIRDQQILLVRHSYQSGWYLPGGGIKRGETVTAAAHREAREELGAVLGSLTLFGIYTNFSEAKSDHMIVLLSHEFSIQQIDNKEIEEAMFFSLHQLPASISPGSRNRVQEYLTGNHKPVASDW